MAEFLDSETALDNCVWQTVHATPAFDCCTALHGWRFPDSACPWGIDAWLTVPELVAMLFRTAPRSPDNPGQILRREDFAALPLNIQAEMVWHRIFVAQTPFCETAREVLTSLGMLQLNPDERNLDVLRAALAKIPPEKLWAKIMQSANLCAVAVPCDPLRAADAALWPAGGDKRTPLPGIKTFLSLDTLLAWENGGRAGLQALGAMKKETVEIDKTAVAAVLRFLGAWLKRGGAQFFAVDWCAGFDLTAKKHPGAKLLRKCVLPFCVRHDVPLLLNLGARPRLPEEHQPAVLAAETLEALCAAASGVRLVLNAAVPSARREVLTVAARYPQITVLSGGDTPSTLAESVRESAERLGGDFLPFASGAWVPGQLPGKWAHARWTLGKVLQAHYRELRRTGRRISEKEIRTDVDNLLRLNALKKLSPLNS